MSNDPHRSEYFKRINRVLDYIRAHRDERLTLDTLADVAGFSRFHFHRIFKTVTGENVNEHIQRTRLEAAAQALITRPRADILGVALDHGFSSASTFARAFKERFGMSASRWRASISNTGQSDGNTERSRVARSALDRRPAGGGSEGRAEPGATRAERGPSNRSQANGNVGKATPALVVHCSTTPPTQPGDAELTMEVQVSLLPSYRVAYLRTIGPYGPDGAIPATWQRLMRWAQSRDLWGPDRVCLGIGHDNPHVTPPELCRHDAAVVVPEGFAVDGDVSVMLVEGGKYAIAELKRGGPGVPAAYDHIFGRWLPDSGYQPDDRLMFERYIGDLESESGRAQVCVPVRPL